MLSTAATAEVSVPHDVLRLQRWSRLGIAMGHTIAGGKGGMGRVAVLWAILFGSGGD